MPDASTRKTAFQAARTAPTFDALMQLSSEWSNDYGPPPPRVRNVIIYLHLLLACRTLSGRVLYEDEESGKLILKTQHVKAANWEALRRFVPGKHASGVRFSKGGLMTLGRPSAGKHGAVAKALDVLVPLATFVIERRGELMSDVKAKSEDSKGSLEVAPSS